MTILGLSCVDFIEKGTWCYDSFTDKFHAEPIGGCIGGCGSRHSWTDLH
jgi:hypothetical protein